MLSHWDIYCICVCSSLREPLGSWQSHQPICRRFPRSFHSLGMTVVCRFTLSLGYIIVVDFGHLYIIIGKKYRCTVSTIRVINIEGYNYTLTYKNRIGLWTLGHKHRKSVQVSSVQALRHSLQPLSHALSSSSCNAKKRSCPAGQPLCTIA